MRIHFIAIGGSAMHNLAIALHNQGYKISGSDDEIFEPSKSRLKKLELLPSEFGWFPSKIKADIDAVVLGMHAKIDNPELLKAQELGIKIFSYPEFLYEQTKNKKRVVIGGSHGKTSTTAMVMHVLNVCGRTFDYMVGAQLDGFETMVQFNENSEYAIFEGDEYLTSPIDLRPKFHLYKPNIALITGIAWDHINVFPTLENYIDQFNTFINLIEDNGSLIYFTGDDVLKKLAKKSKPNIEKYPYNTHEYKIIDGVTFLLHNDNEIPIKIFGEHNLQNLAGAYWVCKKMGISDDDFYSAIQSFAGAAKRLQMLASNKNSIIFQDFAHSPSKLKATVNAVKKQFSEKKLICFMELHTYSSLNKEFLVEYEGSLDLADVANVFYSKHAVELKKLEYINPSEVEKAFNKQGLKVFTEKSILEEEIKKLDVKDSVILFLSSGNFNGINVKDVAEKLIEKNV